MRRYEVRIKYENGREDVLRPLTGAPYRSPLWSRPLTSPFADPPDSGYERHEAPEGWQEATEWCGVSLGEMIEDNLTQYDEVVSVTVQEVQ